MKIKTQRWWDVPAALFLLGALLSAAIRLQRTNWTEHLGIVSFVVIVGAAAGLALGKSIFRGHIAFLFGLVYTAFFIPWRLGLLMPEMEWLQRLSLLYARLWYATADFLANRPVKDPILFLTSMVALYWLASLLSSYQLVRRTAPWIPLLSLGGMILVIEYTLEMYRYARVSGSTYSFLYLVFLLLLMGRIYFLRSRKEWEQRGGTVEMEVGYDLGRGVAVAAVALALVAWNTPRLINFFDSNNPARERVSASFQQFRDRISKAADSLRSPDPVIVEGYGSNMFLGTGGNLSDSIMFTVTPDAGSQRGRYYWSGRTYDFYRGDGQWESTLLDSKKIGPAEAPLQYPEWEMRNQVQLTITSNIPLLKTLYFTSEPLNINRDAQVVTAIAADGTMDVNAIVVDPPLKAGESYTVRATIAQPTVKAMREAGDEYPDWITERYLQLPDDFSPRIAELASQIAGDEASNYDKAVAVTQYLRRTITYSESVPQPPRNREPIEWFLFDHRAGFCNYYATAEVLMLRSLGIPARMVQGYAEGTFDSTDEKYVVIGKDSHAWPEVYFPELGWVVFEPTVSQDAVSFPLGEDAQAFDSGDPDALGIEPTVDPMELAMAEQRAADLLNEEMMRSNTALDEETSPLLIGLILAVVGIGLLVFLEYRRRKAQDLPLPSWLEKAFDERGLRTPGWLRFWSRRALRTPMENLFESVGLMLRFWGEKVGPSLTPAEQVATLVNLVPAVRPYALTLLEEYQRAMYSQYPANLLRARQAVTEMRSIGIRSWFMHLIGFET